jgi:uncharacterized protein YfiM (DUF2279 family)
MAEFDLATFFEARMAGDKWMWKDVRDSGNGALMNLHQDIRLTKGEVIGT